MVLAFGAKPCLDVGFEILRREAGPASSTAEMKLGIDLSQLVEMVGLVHGF